MIKVRVNEVGGVFKEVEVNEDSTIQDVLAKAGVGSHENKTIRRNDDDAELDDTVNNGDLIYVVPGIKGNV